MKKLRLFIVCLLITAFVSGCSVSNNTSFKGNSTSRTKNQQISFNTSTPSPAHIVAEALTLTQTVTAAPKTAAPKATETKYVLNTNTKKFHYPSCSSVDQMKEKNKKIVTWSRQEIIDAGYDPCGRCHP